MTRPFNQRVRCAHCGNLTTEESPFERWFRNHPALDAKGITRFDCDLWIHKYYTTPSSETQFVMMVETKTHNAVMSPCQRDSLGLFWQVMRNRKPSVNGAYTVIDHRPVDAYSTMRGRRVPLRMLGGHILQLSGTDPENSETMLWDGKPITVAQLEGLLVFDIDPDHPHGDPAEWLRTRDGLACVA